MSLVGNSLEYYDKRFYDLTVPIADVEELFSGNLWAEGPVWFAEYQMVAWSDIPNNRILRWTADTGVGVMRANSNYANGGTRDLQGRMVSCEHLGRRVSRAEPDGSTTVIADSYNGKKLNSPNDVVVKSDGSVWFTDPDYGIMSDYEGARATPEQPACHVFRVDGKTGKIRVVAADFAKPNGLAFSHNEKILYIADSGLSHDPKGPHHIRAFDVTDDGKLKNGRVFAVIDPGVPDGFRVDSEGNVWTSCQDGVICIAPDGTQLGKIKVPQMVSNLCFGGPKRNRLFMTATKSLYAVYVSAVGAQRP